MFHLTNNWFANSFLYLWVTCLVRLLPLFLIFSASRSQHWRCGGPRLCSTRQTHMNLALSICVLHQSLCNQFVCSCPRRRCCCCDGSIIESKVCHNACSLWWCSLDWTLAFLITVTASESSTNLRLLPFVSVLIVCASNRCIEIAAYDDYVFLATRFLNQVLEVSIFLFMLATAI